MHDRRAFLTRMVALAAASMAPALGRAQPPQGMGRDAWYLYRMLRGVEIGETFVGDWSVIDAYPPRTGAVVLIVAEGLRPPVRVDVCRRDDPVRAPAFTNHLELYVMDGGGGCREMPRSLVAALQVLAERLEDNEAQDLLADELLTHRERLDAFPAELARAARELAPR